MSGTLVPIKEKLPRPKRQRQARSMAAPPRVTMSNRLTSSAHSLTLAEKRLVSLAISKINSTVAAPPDRIIKSRIYAEEFARLFEVDHRSTAYRELQVASDKLFERQFSFMEDGVKAKRRWVITAKYQPKEGWVDIHWHPDVLEHLTGLKRHFTSYRLAQASALRRASSWRLLELLMRYQNTGSAEYDVNDFSQAMDAPPSLQKDFAQLRRRIIEPAVEELRKKSNLLVNWEPIKAGRRVKAIRFDFMPNPQGALDLGI